MLWLLYLFQRTRIDAWFFPRCHLEPLAFCNKRTGKRIPVPALLGIEAVSVALPNLADDVDTMDDLTRLQLRAGPRTQACLAELEGSLV